jgi:uncharacterized protein YndB with AHSA1/START domain
VPLTPPETSVVEHEVRVAARPETVFEYFTDPSRMVQWMGAQATLDPRPGGVCRIVFRPSEARIDALRGELDPAEEAPGGTGEGLGVAAGRFIEVDPPHRISFSWGWEQEVLAVPPQSTQVEVTLTPDGDETVVRLTHRRLPAAAVAFHRAGWDHYLLRLTIAAAGADPGVDPWQGGEN